MRPLTATVRVNDTLVGARSPARLQAMRRAYVALVLSPFVVYLALVAFVTAMDPFDVYAWGPEPKLVRDRYNVGTALPLLNVLAHSQYDTFIVGSSTAEEFLPSDAEQTLIGSEHVFAVVYNGPLPRDLAMVMNKIAEARNIKRVVLTFDTTWFYPQGAARTAVPYALYEARVPYLQALDSQSLELSWRLLLGEEYFIPEWDYRRNESGSAREYRRSLEPAARQEAEQVIRRHKHDVLAEARIDCAAFPALGTIASFAHRLEARNARLDIVVPPFSYLAYYQYAEGNRRHIVQNKPALAAFLAIRRCLVETTLPINNVNVYAFDLHREIAGDLANYRDGTHLNGSKVGRLMLSLINAGEGRLTLDNFDAYATQLRHNVASFQYTNSAMAQVP